MNLSKKQLALLNIVRGWSESDVIQYFKNNNLEEYAYFAEAKSLNGHKLLSLSEGVIAMWRPKVDHKKIMGAIQDLINDPEKYLEDRNKSPAKDLKAKPEVPDRSHLPKLLDKNHKRYSNQVKFIDKDIEPPKSFLYRDKNNSKCANNCIDAYVPMNGNSNSENETAPLDSCLNPRQDRGYYEMSNESGEKSNTIFAQDENAYEELNFSSKKKMGILKRMLKPPIHKPKPNSEDIKMCKKKIHKKEHNSKKTISNRSFNRADLEDDFTHPCTDLTGYKKINDDTISDDYMIVCPEYSEIDENEESSSVKVKDEHFDDVTTWLIESKPFNLTRLDEEEATPAELENQKNRSGQNDDSLDLDAAVPDEHFYETPEMREDLMAIFEDEDVPINNNIVVEDYLEPRKFYKEKSGEAIMDSLADEMIKLFDANFTSDKSGSRVSSEIVDLICRTMVVYYGRSSSQDRSKKDPSKSETEESKSLSETETMLPSPQAEEKPVRSQPLPFEDVKPLDAVRRWNESFGRRGRTNVDTSKKILSVDMSERPLPVPVENEFYYMEIGRAEAEALLEGQPDGTFILRPSSQSNHAYTVTLMYQGRIYNIGCRRRQDGRLALGFTKATEPHFLTINELIEYYYEEKLILLVDGKKVGSTVLKRLHP